MPTVSRVLPWRRNEAPSAELAPLLSLWRSRHPRSSPDLLVKAWEVASEVHGGQERRSGEPYIRHPLAVAQIVAELGLDDVAVAAALLHDTVEDTGLSVDDVRSIFGPEVAAIVDGVTKLDRIDFSSREAQQAATLRKMIVAMARDIRVLIIKLADRLHNMRTVAALPAYKQRSVAEETMEVYAPLAHRLGMQEIRQQLEDLAFATLHPKRYAEIDHMVAMRAPERDLYLAQLIGEVSEQLARAGIKAQVTGRPKHLWSIYEKMVVKGREFDDIYDLIGIRVITENVRDCYAVLGSVHSRWKPVQGRFKDYIAMPKFNLYQSLHTTVVGPQGKHIEVQIRTREMHQRAEYGIAAHWLYKSDSPSEEMDWLKRLVEWQADSEDPDEFMTNLRLDLEQDEVFVFTPKGEVVTLPMGSTPVDFAYAIHTEVGHSCIGARVDGRLVPLDTKLQSGNTVEIFTSRGETTGPSRDWLSFVVTHRAKSKIRQWFAREEREDAIDSGREELLRALRREGLPAQKVLGGDVLDAVAASLNYQDRDALFAAIGANHVSARAVAGRVRRKMSGEPDVSEQLPTTVRTRPPRSRGSGTGVHVEGLDDVLIRFSRCCRPVPGDEIIGFVTRGRGVSIHRSDCANAVVLAAEQGDRLIDVEWAASPGAEFIAAVEVKALDRARLLQDVVAVLSDHHANITHCSTHTGPDRIARLRFEFELGDASQVEVILSRIRAIDSVYDAYRLLPGARR
ncbi:MAG: GTP pyrophosphokinase [Acidimicrobiales bacterium]|nr:MAG: GTP pyrophosphokinase [Acidimicrobiales bacterium]